MLHCENCGGSLLFDIESQKLKCQSCDSLYEVEDVEDAQPEEDIEMAIYTCPSCGGEIISPTKSSLKGFCSFCGQDVTFQRRMEGRKRPKKIIPFQITKEQCQESFHKSFGRLSPKEFKEMGNVESIRGIYIPYFNYYTKFDRTKVSGQGTRTFSRGNKDVEEFYTINANVSGITISQFDASSALPDDLSQSVGKFYLKQEKDFSTDYMEGFYGDVSDIEETTYVASAKDAAIKKVENKLSQKLDGNVNLEKNMSEKAETKVSRSLFPYWFLTWRNQNRVAYAVVNGETGQVAMDRPIDVKKYFGLSVVVSLILFFILNAVLSLTSRDMLMWIGVLSMFSMYFYLFCAKQAMKKDSRVGDLGIGKKGEKETYIEFIFAGIFFLSIALSVFFGDSTVGLRRPIYYCIMIIAFGFGIFDSILIKITYKQKWHPFVDMIGVILGMVLCTGCHYLYSNAYSFYNVAGILAGICNIWTLLRMMKRYNMMCTHPIPDFHDRQGGDNRAF